MSEKKRMTRAKLAVLSLILIALAAAVFFFVQNASKITKEEAEQIAIAQATKDGYESPKRWEEYGSDMYDTYIYSEKQDKDVRTWEIRLDAQGNDTNKHTPAVIYYVDQHNGEIVRTIHGWDSLNKD